MKLKNKKLIISFVLFFLVIFNFYRSYRLFNIKYLTNKFNYKEYENKYFNSQWVIPQSKNSIGDDILYTYAGVKYLQGTDPSLLNPEHPPLGKNLIGLFSLYLKNEYFFSIFSGLFALFSFYLLSQNFLKNKILSIILSLIIAFEPLFAANYFSNNLDLLVFAFLNLYFYFIFKYLENKKIKNIIFLNILLGIIISVKFYLLALPIIASTLFYFLIKKDKRFIFFYLLTLPLTGIVLVLNYFQYFSKNHSFIDFLKLQKYIFVFHIQGREKALNLNFSIFELLFFGKYYPNLKNWTFEKHYSIFWLIVSFFGYLSLIFKKYFSPISSWIIFYTFFQMFSFTSAKYLIILLPFLYLSFFNLLNQKIK